MPRTPRKLHARCRFQFLFMATPGEGWHFMVLATFNEALGSREGIRAFAIDLQRGILGVVGG
jgi:hypothetical protein